MVIVANEQFVDLVAVVIGQGIQQRSLENCGHRAEPLAEGDILASTARQDCHELAALGRDVA